MVDVPCAQWAYIINCHNQRTHPGRMRHLHMVPPGPQMATGRRVFNVTSYYNRWTRPVGLFLSTSYRPAQDSDIHRRSITYICMFIRRSSTNIGRNTIGTTRESSFDKLSLFSNLPLEGNTQYYNHEHVSRYWRRLQLLGN